MRNNIRVCLTIFFSVVWLFSLAACGSQTSGGGQTESGSGNDSAAEKQGQNGNKPRITIKIAFPSGKGSMFYEAASLYKEKVETRSNGEIEVQLFPDGQLGKDLAVLDALKVGSVEMSIPSSVMATKSPEFGVFDIPFLFADRSKVAQIAHGEVWEQDLKGLLPQHGLVGLGFWENGFRQITNNKRPINTPEDLQGLKIRVPDSKIRVAMFQVLGANPTPMDFSEVFTALQQGVVDGQENPLATIQGGKLEEVQKYLSITNHTYTPAYLVASKKWFDALSPEDQELLTTAAVEVGDEIRTIGEKADEELINYFKEKGLEVNEADFAAFKEKTKPVIDMMKEEVDPAFVDKVIRAAE